MLNLPTNFTELIVLLANYKLLVILFSLSFSLAITLIVMPRIIAISIHKNLTASINERTSHVGSVPTLGGIGVFIGLFLTINIVGVLFATHKQLMDLLILNILLLVLLLVGICDDIMILRARRKFIFQLVIAFVFTLSTGIRIDSFEGLFAMHELHPILSVAFTVFVIVLIINAYNLIDGIDGLAGSVGLTISVIFAGVFYMNHHFLASLVSTALVGALVAFLIHNFSNNQKIFLGDTGSMVVGFVLAFQVVLFLSLSPQNLSPSFNNAPLMVLALLSYPLIDTLRVFIVRIKNGQSPFIADRNHIHHRLIDLGISHKYATLLIVCYTTLVTILAYSINELSINLAFAILLPVSLLLLALPYAVERKQNYVGFRLSWSWKVAEHKEA